MEVPGLWLATLGGTRAIRTRVRSAGGLSVSLTNRTLPEMVKPGSSARVTPLTSLPETERSDVAQSCGPVGPGVTTPIVGAEGRGSAGARATRRYSPGVT